MKPLDHNSSEKCREQEAAPVPDDTQQVPRTSFQRLLGSCGKRGYRSRPLAAEMRYPCRGNRTGQVTKTETPLFQIAKDVLPSLDRQERAH